MVETEADAGVRQQAAALIWPSNIISVPMAMRRRPTAKSLRQARSTERNCGSMSGRRQMGPAISTGKNAM